MHISKFMNRIKENNRLCSLEMLKLVNTIEPAHDKTNKMACAPSEDPDQPGHPPRLGEELFPFRVDILPQSVRCHIL